MGCCNGSDRNDEHNLDDRDEIEYSGQRNFDETFRGPISDRSCTDIVCCILFLIFIIAQGVLCYFAFTQGNPKVLIYPVDSQGRFCDFDSQAGKPYLMFFDPVQCMKAGARAIATGCPTPQICVKECPKDNFVWIKLDTEEKLLGRINITERQRYLRCIDGVNISDTNLKISDLISSEKCAPYYVESRPIFKRCFPRFLADMIKQAANNSDYILNKLEDRSGAKIGVSNFTAAVKFQEYFVLAARTSEMVIHDIVNSWRMILIGICVGALLSFIWCFLMRWVSCVIVYLSLLTFFFVFLGSAGYCLYYYHFKATQSVNHFKEYVFILDMKSYLDTKQTWLVLGIIASILTFIVLVVLLCLRKRISIAVAIIGEASKAVASILTTLVFPIFPFVFQILVIGFSSTVGVYLMAASRTLKSNSSIISDCNLTGIQVNSIKEVDQAINDKTLACALTAGGSGWPHYLQAYNLFMFFWLLCFVVAFGQLVLAGTFASWYWAWEKPKDIPTMPIWSSFWRAIRYHLGTVAFGSLIIAIVMMIRAILAYMQQKLKGSQNKVAQFILCVFQCCFWCLEKCLKFLTKNAYIITAIYGLNFCSAAKDAFMLILRNCLRLAVVDCISSFVLFVGKLLMTGITGTFAFFFFNGTIPSFFGMDIPQLNYYFLPMIIIIIGTYAVASLFFDVYDFCVDTLFICVMEDLERNDGSKEKPYFMSKELMKVMDRENKFKDDAEKRQGCGLCCC